MAIYVNNNQMGKIYVNNNSTNKVFVNGSQVYASEKSFVPTWTLSGNGWTNTTWGSWGVGRDEGTSLTGVATTTFDTEGHSKLKFTPNSYGWRTATTGGGIRIYINDTLKFELLEHSNRTTALDIDISSYSGNITVRVELSATWGYTDMYTDTSLLLYD